MVEQAGDRIARSHSSGTDDIGSGSSGVTPDHERDGITGRHEAAPLRRLTGRASNPFSTHRLEPGRGGYIFPQGQSWEDTVARLHSAGWRGELTGPHGAGKSTLLADLCEHLRNQGQTVVWWQMRDVNRRPPKTWREDLARADIIACDGAERLLPGVLWALRLWTRWRGIGLLVTTHRRHGFPVVIPIKSDATALAVKVARLMAPRLGGNRPGDPMQDEERGEDHRNWNDIVDAALKRHNGDARRVLFELYEEFERGKW